MRSSRRGDRRGSLANSRSSILRAHGESAAARGSANASDRSAIFPRATQSSRIEPFVVRSMFPGENKRVTKSVKCPVTLFPSSSLRERKVPELFFERRRVQEKCYRASFSLGTRRISRRRGREHEDVNFSGELIYRTASYIYIYILHRRRTHLLSRARDGTVDTYVLRGARAGGRNAVRNRGGDARAREISSHATLRNGPKRVETRN